MGSSKALAATKPFLALAALLVGGYAMSDVSFNETERELSLSGDTYVATFSKENGALVRVVDTRASGEVCAGAGALWRLEFIDHKWLSAGDFSAGSDEKRFTHRWEGGVLRLMYVSAEANVEIAITPTGDSLDSRATIEARNKTVLTLNYPHRLTFEIEPLNRFCYPHRLGVALKREFYLGASEFGPRSLRARYPGTIFCDFAFLDSQSGTSAVYTIQDQEVLVPAQLETGPSRENDALGFYDHQLITYVAEGENWSSPTLRMEVGGGVQDALARYGEANGFSVPLREKMKPDVLERFIRSVHISYFGEATFKEATASLSKFPSPVLLQHCDYMLGGFDKQYPDFLPPNPKLGTAEELRELYDRAHELGLLMMPYLNPTWWGDDPPSPSFQKYGEVPLSRDLDGKIHPEKYGRARGYTLTTGHPIAQEIERRNTRLFTVDYPSDLLFHDQIGARSYRYDLNPACSPPYAFNQQLIDVAKEQSKVIPLSTEEGHDALINYESQFSGLATSWGMVFVNGRYQWSRDYADLFSPEEWERYPLALFLAHDKVAFSHQAGPKCRDKRALSYSLAIGYQTTYSVKLGGLDNPGIANWLRWLSAIQKRVCARYMEKKLTDFRYLAHDVSQSVFEDITIVANLTDEPYRVSPTCVIAPNGFQATTTSGDLLAGTFAELNGIEYPDELWMIREVTEGEMKVWALNREAASVCLRRPASWRGDSAIRVEQVLAAGPKPVRHTAAEKDLRFEITPPPTEGIVEVPGDLKGIAPRDRARPPKCVGVLDLEPKPPYGTTVGYGEWAEIFADSPLVKEHGISVSRIATLDDLWEACYQKASEHLLIINPYGEEFPARSSGEWRETLDAIRHYVQHGGVWWETGGYSFFYEFHPQVKEGKVVGWERRNVGGSGLEFLAGCMCPKHRYSDPASPLHVTEAGREWLGDDLTRRLAGKEAFVFRPSGGGQVALLDSPKGAYIPGYQLGGWGWFFRVGGRCAKEVVPRIIVRVAERTYNQPPSAYPRRPSRLLTEHTVVCGP